MLFFCLSLETSGNFAFVSIYALPRYYRSCLLRTRLEPIVIVRFLERYKGKPWKYSNYVHHHMSFSERWPKRNTCGIEKLCIERIVTYKCTAAASTVQSIFKQSKGKASVGKSEQILLWTDKDHASEKATTCCLLHWWAFIWYDIYFTAYSKVSGKMGDGERPVTATSPAKTTAKTHRMGNYSAVKWSTRARSAVGCDEWFGFCGFTKSACTLRKLWTHIQSWSFTSASTKL